MAWIHVSANLSNALSVTLESCRHKHSSDMIDECGFSFRGEISIFVNCKTHWKILFLPFCVSCQQVDIGEFFLEMDRKGWTFFDEFFLTPVVCLKNINHSGISYFQPFSKKELIFFCFVIIFKVSTAGCFHAIIPPHKVLPRNHSTRLHFHI